MGLTGMTGAQGPVGPARGEAAGAARDPGRARSRLPLRRPSAETRCAPRRALLLDPRILILDEATSSVDTETEQEIQKALDNLVQGRTTIAIAHRLSTLQRANRLVVMDRGKVVEEGPHEELMAKEGAYYRLYQAQARNVDTDLDDNNTKRHDDN